MWFCWFLACCLTARQDEGKKIKRCVKRYGLVELKRELRALGVHIDEDVDKTKKKTKKKLQKLLIKELKKIEDNKKGLENRAYNDYTMPTDTPEYILSALTELEALIVYIDDDVDEAQRKYKRKKELQNFLINELKEVEHGKTDLDNQDYKETSTMLMEIPESERNEGEALLDSLVDSTLEGRMKRKRKREHGGWTLEAGKRRRSERPVSGVPYRFTNAPSLGGGFVW
ncbi:uncharacterized protein LOC121698765 [Alosa sapidissima]|uniref:uncharacterized protein LOC121698765 n=1 Tax=Alosa sapidissima TaxID=34773 RepID=UPI001C086F29|nr:uncharacterized protein LOC121698765 [Alosa sapidissima]